jgi:hypothetical protein
LKSAWNLPTHLFVSLKKNAARKRIEEGIKRREEKRPIYNRSPPLLPS